MDVGRVKLKSKFILIVTQITLYKQNKFILAKEVDLKIIVQQNEKSILTSQQFAFRKIPPNKQSRTKIYLTPNTQINKFTNKKIQQNQSNPIINKLLAKSMINMKLSFC